MALTNSQYDMIMRDYQNRRLQNDRIFEKKLDAAYERFPRLKEIDDEIASLSIKKARITLGASSDSDFDLEAFIEELSAEKSTLLEMAGFKGGKAEPEYDCPLCNDTGNAGGRKCSCFRQAEVNLIYAQSGLGSILEKENFSTFDLSLYSNELKNPSTGLSARETAKKAYDYSKLFVENFENEKGNICFFGQTGVGKSFLSHCIAKSLMDKGVSVLYLTAFDLFHIFEENTFRPTEETNENSQLVFDSELLIIDDLGANVNNSFISSSLFQCINERMNSGKSTIISTNLSISELRDAFSDRVTSRIMSGYQRLYLFGDDIRIKKKLSSR